ncbi:hypothetical protein ACS0TY_033495 [Phlomoides rotata]
MNTRKLKALETQFTCWTLEKKPSSDLEKPTLLPQTWHIRSTRPAILPLNKGSGSGRWKRGGDGRLGRSGAVAAALVLDLQLSQIKIADRGDGLGSLRRWLGRGGCRGPRAAGPRRGCGGGAHTRRRRLAADLDSGAQKADSDDSQRFRRVHESETKKVLMTPVLLLDLWKVRH